jgi:hypothetical protein
MKSLVIYCADIGSIALKRFAWSRKQAASWQTGTQIGDLARSVAEDLIARRPVALGFECPLFVPLPQDAADLGRAREQEMSRSWSAGAGTGALATGLVQAVWVLRTVREIVGPRHRAFLNWQEFLRAGTGLLLWEAFVSGSAKRRDHLADAKAGVRAFELGISQGVPISHISCREETYSLIGAAMLRGRWSRDIGILGESCLVFKGSRVRASQLSQRPVSPTKPTRR